MPAYPGAFRNSDCQPAMVRRSSTPSGRPEVHSSGAAPIPYWDAVEDDNGVLVASSAEEAETPTTAFAGTPDAVTARLVVRRVRRLCHPYTGGHLELDTPIWRHDALLTDRTDA